MSVEELVDRLLGMMDGGERQAFLGDHWNELSVAFFTEMKNRSDALLLEHPGRALEIAEVAFQAASFAATPPAEARARWARGNALTYLGWYGQALEDYSRACATYSEQSGDELAVARLQTNMVNALKNLGRYDEALAQADAARDTLQPWGESHYLAILEMNVGSVYRVIGRYEDTLAAYERGRAIFAALGNQAQVARMDVNRARVLVCLDRFREAQALLQTASRTLREEGKALSAARATLNLATLLSRQGHHRQALETYAQARAAFTALDDETDVAVTDLYRTYDYLALNLLPEALELSTEAQNALAQQKMPRYIALAAGNRAVAARKMGHYTEALEALFSARVIFAERDAWVEAALLDLERAICLRESGDPMTGVAVATEAMQVLADHNLPLQTAHARLTLADSLLALAETDQAESLYLLAREAMAETPSLAWQAHDGLGRVAEARGQIEAAYRHYQKAIACIETTEDELGIDEFRAGFLDDKLDVYRRAVRLALALGDQEGAFSHAEQSKTGVWRDFLARRRAEAKEQTELQVLREQWHWLYNRLTRLDEDEETVRGGAAEKVRWAELRALEKRIAQAKRQSSQALEKGPGLSLSAAQQRVPADTLLLDYYCTTEEVVVFLISAAKVRVFEHLAPLTEVERAANRWRFNVESMRVPALSFSTQLSDEAGDVLYTLYQLLVEPLALHLANYRSLWVIPHGMLWTIPFAALYDGEQYLVERFKLTCLPGLAAREQNGQRESPDLADAPLIVGYSEEGRVSHAVQEAQMVAATLGRGELLLENQATIERLQAAACSCTLLHLATHGFFRSDAPLFSALHLADGWLTAGDLEGWDLSHVELVTLSACETGVLLSWGSDLLGLARGFFRAGARQLVASLWTVDDVSTAELMARFYDALQTGKKAASALQEAQTAALQKYRHPFYWAGLEVMTLI